MAAIWNETLGTIPSDVLKECFNRALRHKTSPYPLTVFEVIAAWEDWRPSYMVEMRAAERMSLVERREQLLLSSGPAEGPRSREEWAAEHLATCDGCDDKAYLLAHGTLAEVFAQASAKKAAENKPQRKHLSKMMNLAPMPPAPPPWEAYQPYRDDESD